MAVLGSIGASVSIVVFMTLSRGLVNAVPVLNVEIFICAVRFGTP